MVIKIAFWVTLALTFLGSTVFFITGSNWIPAVITAAGMIGSMYGLVEDLAREPKQ